MENEDKFLVEQYQLGKNDAFNELIKKYQDVIYRQCYQFTYNVDDAIDLTQEVFLRAYKSLNSFKGRSNFSTWLYRIAYNACKDYLRNKKSCVEAENAYLEYNSDKDLQNSPSELTEEKELIDEIRKAMRMLSPQARNAIILKYFEGLDYQSIADILGCGINTVKTNISKGIRMLRNILPSHLKYGHQEYKGGESKGYKGSLN